MRTTDDIQRIVRLSVLVLASAAVTCLPSAAQPPQEASEAVIEGTLDVLYEDDDRGGRLLHVLDTGRRRIPLRFRSAPPDLPSGARVRVRGGTAPGDVADGGFTVASTTTLAVPAERTMGGLDVLVVLLNFTSDPQQPYTAAAADTVNAQVRDFYDENSYGQTTLNFTVTGWHTIAGPNNTCDYYGWATQADAAAAGAGFDPASFDRRVYAFPKTSVCSWWGMGNVGGPRSWVNGTYGTRVVAHELGHNFGNHHSMALRCDETGCTAVEYGDDRDVMGVSGVIGHTNVFQKERLGWLNYGSSPPIETVTGSNVYWLEPVSTASTGQAKGLKIWNPSAGTYYYIETRARAGFDSSAAPGVVLHSGSPTVSKSSYQLDFAPLSTTWDSTLDPGQMFSDSGLGLHVTTLSADASGALVQVDFGALRCVPVPPSISMTPADALWGPPGSPLDYTVTITNNNGAECEPSALDLAAASTLPAGWTAYFGSASLSLASGAAASILARITPPSSTAAGRYEIALSAQDRASSLGASVVGAAWVAPTLDLGLAVSPAAPTRSTGLSLTTSVRLAQLTTVPGAAVTVSLRTPAGATYSAAGVTDNNGISTVTFRLNKRKDPAGSYVVTVSADKSGITGTATTTVAVK